MPVSSTGRLDHLPIKTKWVLRLDADEYLYPELIDEIKAKLASLPEDVTGVAFKRAAGLHGPL
jgi:hypothetical protein